jgi:hypothetical protein
LNVGFQGRERCYDHTDNGTALDSLEEVYLGGIYNTRVWATFGFGKKFKNPRQGNSLTCRLPGEDSPSLATSGLPGDIHAYGQAHPPLGSSRHGTGSSSLYAQGAEAL